MAIGAIKTFITSKKLGSDISNKAKIGLAKIGVEQYIFHKQRIMEWCFWVEDEVGNIIGTDIGGYERDMTAAFFSGLKNDWKKSNEPIAMNFEKSAFVVTQLDRGLTSWGKASSASRKHINRAKTAAIKKLAEKLGLKLTPKEIGDLKAGMTGHHAGVVSPTERSDKRFGSKAHLPGAEKTVWSDEPKTTAGMLKVRADVEKAKWSVTELADVISGTDITKAEALRDVVFTRLANWIDVQLGFDRDPKKMLDRSRQKRGELEVGNIIYIHFALSSGRAHGSQYTAAMKAWDAGPGTGKLSSTINKALANIEIEIVREIMSKMTSYAPDLIALHGSPSPLDNIITGTPKWIIDNMFPHATRADMRFKVNKKLAAGIKLVKKVKVRNVKTKVKGQATTKLLAVKLAQHKRKRKASGSGAANARTTASPIALRNMLNEILPQQVAQNMVAPALRFRTGRLANSARVQQVIVGPRGGTTVEYTYQKAPYETFEPGGKQGSTLRDPRKLIGQSLREVATGIIGTRFTTRRV